MNVDEALRHHRFTRALTAAQRRVFVELGTLQTFDAGEWLIRQHRHADAFFLLFDGHVQIEATVSNGEARALQTLGPGDALGWSWFTELKKWHFNGFAVEPTTTLIVDGPALKNAMEKDHSLGYAVLKELVNMLVHRLQASRIQMLDVYDTPGGRVE